MMSASEPPTFDSMSAQQDSKERAAHVPSTYEHALVRSAGNVVAICARQVARQFSRIVWKHGSITRDDLIGVGTVALYGAARVYDEKKNPDFETFARYRVRGAMLNELDDLLFEERLKRAAMRANNNYDTYAANDDYDVMKHDEPEAKRRHRAFASGLLATMFAAAVEEAQHCEETELAERQEYDRAIALLETALAKLAERERAILVLTCGELLTLKAAAKALAISYGVARAMHARARSQLHDVLVEHGITRMPRPRLVPSLSVLDSATAAVRNDTGDPKPTGERWEPR